MSSKNLAAFSRQRPSLKVAGTTPNMQATSQVSQQTKSVFSQGSRFMDRNRKAADAQSGTTSMRIRKQAVAEHHKKRIMEAVNQLNDEELERVSEMLRVSEAVNENEPAEDDVNVLDEANEEQDQVGDIEINNPVVRIAEDQASSVS